MRRSNVLTALLLVALTACRAGPEPRPEAPPPQAAEPAREEAWRASAPQPDQSPELVLPTFQRASLPNGMGVLVSTRRELPLVSFSVACQAGAASDPKGKAGLANLSYAMLLEGAAGKDALQLDDAFANLGASPSLSVGADGSQVGTTVLKRNAGAALALLADVVRKPNLVQKDFDRRKKQQLANLAQQTGSPGFLAQQAFAEVAYGGSHPYGHLSSGTPRSVGSLTLADVKSYLRRHLGPKACAVVASGDITLEEAQALAQKSFGDWKSAATPQKTPPAPKVQPRKNVVLVPKPGLNQTIVVMGRPALAAGNPDEEALELASTVFGGFFGSRLNMNLREAKGYTYGAGAGVDARKGVGPLSASSAVRADVTGPAVQEFYGELKGLKARPITKEELEAAREGVIRSVPGSFETVEGLTATAAAIYLKDQPLDRVGRLVKGLESADLPQVQQAATTYFQPELMKIVLVGDPDTIRQQVADLGLGPIEQVSPP
ncbi:MAG: insulinase family protein [Myxococcaceae bacterium]|nr:insulinase family protein [Myxococcaceae bacterium]MCI0672917.1 insulinase family protein [Myxococcaceae bacterium]